MSRENQLKSKAMISKVRTDSFSSERSFVIAAIWQKISPRTDKNWKKKCETGGKKGGKPCNWCQKARENVELVPKSEGNLKLMPKKKGKLVTGAKKCGNT